MVIPTRTYLTTLLFVSLAAGWSTAALQAGEPQAGKKPAAGVVRIQDHGHRRAAGPVRRVAYDSDGRPIYWNAYETTGEKVIYRIDPDERHGEPVEWDEVQDGDDKRGFFSRWFGGKWFGHDDTNHDVKGRSHNPFRHASDIASGVFHDVRGRGGHGLFGANCDLDPYRAQCEENAWYRWRHRRACRWNKRREQLYRKDGMGAGRYTIAYPVNMQHFDSRDGRIYAAQGWGVPMAVPMAPNVEYTYNLGWGVPSSRLTRMSHPAAPVVPAPSTNGNSNGNGNGNGYAPQ